jgi:hypothetical protein
MKLANVLYIVGLRVNLLSGRRICEAGLQVNLPNHVCILNVEKIRLLQQQSMIDIM